ncbi:astacin (Peptidase family m12A) domain-containing protein [Ditylenchus destructor]|nr:astacin (Peptidase family m12A) domain-containing protein [Ditylenchus destructor]
MRKTANRAAAKPSFPLGTITVLILVLALIYGHFTTISATLPDDSEPVNIPHPSAPPVPSLPTQITPDPPSANENSDTYNSPQQSEQPQLVLPQNLETPQSPASTSASGDAPPALADGSSECEGLQRAPEATYLPLGIARRKKRSTVGRKTGRIWDEYKQGGKYIIPYAVTSNYNKSQLTRINGAIHAIEEKTCIKFELIDNAKMGSYYKNKSHVEIKNVIGGGCHSVIGRTKGQKNMVKLEIRATASKTCIAHHVILHELLHLLGLYHEHQRPDRDNHITIIRANAIKKRLSNFNRAVGAESFGLPYDYCSIMHYRGLTFSSNSKPVIVAKDAKFQDKLGIAKNPSELDWLKVNVLYRCPGHKQMKQKWMEKNKSLIPNAPAGKKHKKGHKNKNLIKKVTDATGQAAQKMKHHHKGATADVAGAGNVATGLAIVVNAKGKHKGKHHPKTGKGKGKKAKNAVKGKEKKGDESLPERNSEGIETASTNASKTEANSQENGGAAAQNSAARAEEENHESETKARHETENESGRIESDANSTKVDKTADEEKPKTASRMLKDDQLIEV